MVPVSGLENYGLPGLVIAALLWILFRREPQVSELTKQQQAQISELTKQQREERREWMEQHAEERREWMERQQQNHAEVLKAYAQVAEGLHELVLVVKTLPSLAVADESPTYTYRPGGNEPARRYREGKA